MRKKILPYKISKKDKKGLGKLFPKLPKEVSK
jgi:hypothetical protein